MQEPSRIPANQSWGRKIYRDDNKSRYSEDFHVRLVGTRERALSKIKQQIRDVQGAREVVALIVAQDIDLSYLRYIFAWLGNDILRLLDEDYEKIAGQTEDHNASQEQPVSEVVEQEEIAVPPANPTDVQASPKLLSVESVEEEYEYVGIGTGKVRVLPEHVPVVRWATQYPGIYIRTLAQKMVMERGLDLDGEEVKTAMGVASAAHKCGYVDRLGDRFYALGYLQKNAA